MRRLRFPVLASAVLAASLAASLAGPARAGDEHEVNWRDIKGLSSEKETNLQKRDTTYGRVDGDLSVVLGLGATVAPRGPRTAADLRFRYLDTVGIFADYEDGALVKSGSEPRRVFAAGLELRPLFLGRWLRGLELESARIDLLIDSIGLELGAAFAQPEGSPFGSRPGLQAGLGLEIPVLAQASGPWLGVHGGVRWSDSAVSGGTVEGPDDRAAFLTLTVAWHQFFGGHVVDIGDRGTQ